MNALKKLDEKKVKYGKDSLTDLEWLLILGRLASDECRESAAAELEAMQKQSKARLNGALDRLTKPFDDGSYSQLQESAAAELEELRGILKSAHAEYMSGYPDGESSLVDEVRRVLNLGAESGSA